MRLPVGSIVGREAELSRLVGLLEDARLGLGGAALLLGDAGIGKSSLMDSLAREALAGGFRVAWGTCPEREDQPYRMWRQALGSLDASAYASRADLFSGVLESLGDQPLLVLLDDVHRADLASLELLDFVSTQLRGLQVVVVAAARDDPLELPVESAELLAGLPSSMLRLDLGGLDLEATAAVVREAAGDGLDDQVVAGIHERTGGNPFFAAEVARLHAQRQRSGGAALEVPTGVQHVLSRRFARLDQMAHHLLEVAAVCGTPDTTVLAAVTGVTESAVLARLEGAVGARLVVRDDQGLRFAHDLVRETLYAGLGTVARERLHRATAESGVVTDPALLAHHWSRSGSDGERLAAECALLAADAALAQRAYAQAVRFYTWAVEAGVGERIAVGARLGQAQVLAGQLEEGRALLRAVAGDALAAGDAATAVIAVLALGSGPGAFEVDLADTSQVRLLERALDQLGPDQTSLRATALARLSLVRSATASVADRADLARTALELAESSQDHVAECAALAALCDALSAPEYVDDRLHAAGRMLTLADEQSDTALALLALRLRVVANLERGDFAGVDLDIAGYERRADRLRLAIYSWPVPLWRGTRALLDGDALSAASYADRAAAIGEAAGSSNAEVMVWALRLAIAKLGPPDRLDELLATAQTWPIPEAQLDPCFSSIHAWAGRHTQARHHLDRAMRDLDALPRDSEYLELLWMMGEAALVLEDDEAAALIADRLRPHESLWAVDGIGGACFGQVATMVARLDALDPARVAVPTSAREGSLRREGKLWHVEYAGTVRTLPHSKGITDLATLLAAPDREVHVLDLVESGGGPRRAEVGQDTGVVLDEQARTAYRRRLTELEQEIDEATSWADQGRQDALVAEKEFLLAELSGALGLGGRVRVENDPVERARKAVTMRISNALKAIDAVHPDLARHLRASVSTGRFCTYRPELPTTWHLH